MRRLVLGIQWCEKGVLPMVGGTGGVAIDCWALRGLVVAIATGCNEASSEGSAAGVLHRLELRLLEQPDGCDVARHQSHSTCENEMCWSRLVEPDIEDHDHDRAKNSTVV